MLVAFGLPLQRASVTPHTGPKDASWPNAFPWGYCYKGLRLAQRLGQLGAFLTCVEVVMIMYGRLASAGCSST